jgi:hypothetical protein
MATIAELQTKLTVDNTAFKKGMTDSANATKSFADKIKIGVAAAAGSIAVGFIAAFKALQGIMGDAEKRISDLVDTSTRLGVGIGPLQGLQFAAQQSGISIQSLDGALGKMLKNIGNAASSGDSASDAFGKLGLKASVLATMQVDKQYLAIAEAINKIPTAAGQAAAAVAIFGKGGIEQLSLIKDGAGLAIKEFEKLGIKLTTEQGASLESYGDSVKKLGLVWEGFQNQLAAALSGPFKQLLDWIVQASVNMGGLGPVATKVGQAIFSGMSVGLIIVQSLTNAINICIIAFESLAINALQAFRVATLGLADLTTNIAKTQAGFEQDRSDRFKAILSSSATFGAQQALDSAQSSLAAPQTNMNNQQQTVKVEIQAGDGFIAKVTGSTSFQEQLGAGVNNIVQSQAAAGAR